MMSHMVEIGIVWHIYMTYCIHVFDTILTRSPISIKTRPYDSLNAKNNICIYKMLLTTWSYRCAWDSMIMVGGIMVYYTFTLGTGHAL